MRIQSTICAVSLLACAGSASAQVFSQFNSGAEGWRVAGPTPTSHISSEPVNTVANWDGANGNPAGSLRVGDAYVWTWFMAPEAYLGDKSVAYGTDLTYDIFLRFSDNTAYPAVALRGADITLYYSTPSPLLNVWDAQSIPLVEGNWRINNYVSGALATQADVLAVLGDLRGLFILTEWNTGADDTGLDNVFMVPSPASAVLLLGASASITRRRR